MIFNKATVNICQNLILKFENLIEIAQHIIC